PRSLRDASRTSGARAQRLAISAVSPVSGRRAKGSTCDVEVVPLVPRSTEGLRDVLDPRDHELVAEAVSRLRHVLTGRRVWPVTSTRTGGGVAEMLSSVLPYAIDAGVDACWVVIAGDGAFFEITKRIHHRLHDRPGDGGPLGGAERDVYDTTLHES